MDLKGSDNLAMHMFRAERAMNPHCGYENITNLC